MTLLLFFGCQSDVAVSPPEQQRTIHRPEAVGPFVYMSQTNAEEHFVSGIYGLEDNAWRWTARQAVLRLRLKQTSGLKFVMKYTVPVQVISYSKKVRIRILVNGRPWQEIHHDKDGIYELEKPVPAELLKPEADNIVTIEIDKPWPAESNRPEMGLILVHAGFQPAS